MQEERASGDGDGGHRQIPVVYRDEKFGDVLYRHDGVRRHLGDLDDG
jgi:hypothetical protein